MKEKEIEDLILEEHPFMFRNAQGYGVACSPKSLHKLQNGGYLVDHGAPVHFGLFKGSSDMIGFESMTITQEMVGKKVAIFQSIEIKTKNDRLSEFQKKWNKAVEKAGGIVQVWQERKDGSIDRNAKKY